ncbi:MAG: hypothetical protein ACUVUF_03155 [Candidatus Bathycorpusculaceae bacterium]
MKIHKKKIATGSSGQLLIVTALAIAILISSTTAYIYELGMKTDTAPTQSISNFVFALKASTRNAVISSLANVSNGGEKATLVANLNELSQFLRNIRNIGVCSLNFTVLNDALYDSGIQISWNTNIGVLNAYVNFAVSVYGITENVTANYAVNITTAITVNGFFTQTESGKLVNLTCKTYNEDNYALAKNMSFFYENLGSWIPINASNNPSIVDYGDGTYTVTFTVDVSSETVHVLVKAYDTRDILVQAETFCNES